MNFEDLLFSLTSALEKVKVPYMLTGAIAVSYFGRPRATHDFDFVIEVTDKSFKKLKQFLKQLGNEYLKDFTQVEEAVKSGSQFNIFYLPTALKIDFWILKNDSFDVSRFKRRQEAKLGKNRIYLSSPEDLILIKLKWYKESTSEKHLLDAASVFQIQKGRLDDNYLSDWAGKLSVRSYLKKLKDLTVQEW